MLVVAAFHGADVAIGGSRFTAILDVAFGAAALGFAAGLHRGWVQPPHRRDPARRDGASSRMSRHLRNPSGRVSAAAGVGTHLPGLIYLVALNAIASDRPALIADAGLQVAIYNVLWFLVPIASLVLVVLRPGAALAYLQAATAWALRHDHVLLVAGSLALGIYLVVKGTASLLSTGTQVLGDPGIARGGSAGDRELFLRARGDRLQRADGRLDVVDVELAEQPVPRAGDGLAQAAVQGLALGRQVELRVAADQPVGLQPGEQLARRVGVQGPRALEVGAQRLAGEPRPARGDQLQGVPGLGRRSGARRGAGAARPTAPARRRPGSGRTGRRRRVVWA